MTMSRLKPTIGAICLLSLLMPVLAAHGATYIVATTGKDSNPGTYALPWRTVAKAASTMVAGDTTYVWGGTYLETTSVWFKRTGTSSAPIKLLAYPGMQPIIDFTNATDANRRIILGTGSGNNTPTGWITIEGFEIRNSPVGITMFNLHDSIIQRNWIHNSWILNTTPQGILGNGTRILINRNKINHNGRFAECQAGTVSCTHDHGIYVNGTAITITNNLIYDNLDLGIQLNGTVSYDPAKHAGPEYALSANWIIANNTIAYQKYGPGIVVWGSTCNNARIENNIFYENSVTGSSSNTNGVSFTSTTCTGIQIRNNLSYASGSGGATFLGSGATEGVHYTQSGNIVNTLAPRFVNAPATLPASPNFAIQATSPAINKGLTQAGAHGDFLGIPRPQGSGYDIGAYEYVFAQLMAVWGRNPEADVAGYRVYMCLTAGCVLQQVPSEVVVTIQGQTPEGVNPTYVVTQPQGTEGTIAASAFDIAGNESVLSTQKSFKVGVTPSPLLLSNP